MPCHGVYGNLSTWATLSASGCWSAVLFIDMDSISPHTLTHTSCFLPWLPFASKTRGNHQILDVSSATLKLASWKKMPMPTKTELKNTGTLGIRAPWSNLVSGEIINRNFLHWFSDTPHIEQLAMLATFLQPAQKCTLLCEVLYPSSHFPSLHFSWDFNIPHP